MKIAVLGGGRMGGSIALKAAACGYRLAISHPSQSLRNALDEMGANVFYTDDNQKAALGADLIIAAVKPWYIEPVLGEVKDDLDPEKQIVASVAAGISCSQLQQYLHVDGRKEAVVFRVIPNTAVALGMSATFIAGKDASAEQKEAVMKLFRTMGTAYDVTEEQIPAFTALSSCGIAFAFKYIDAALQGGVELGLERSVTLEVLIQTIKGALALLETNGTQPQQEIDKVTTPGGITLKGLAAMDEHGFTKAVTAGLKAAK